MVDAVQPEFITPVETITAAYQRLLEDDTVSKTKCWGTRDIELCLDGCGHSIWVSGMLHCRRKSVKTLATARFLLRATLPMTSHALQKPCPCVL